MKGLHVFVNYFRDETRSTPFNLAFARMVLGGYVIWRVIFFDWGAIQEWPFPLNPELGFLHHKIFLMVLPFQQWFVVAALVLFIVGFKIKWTGLIGALTLMHMQTVTASIYLSGTIESLLVCSYFILFFALFHKDDVLSADGISRTKEQSPEDLNAFLKNGSDRDYPMRGLKWGLVILGFMYFGSAWGKVRRGGLEIWTSGADLQRTFLWFEEITAVSRPLAHLFIQYPTLSWLGHVGTAALQFSLIFAVVLGFAITPIALGLIGFHFASILTLGLYFIDNVLLLSLYLAWDRAYSYLVTDREIDLVYDEHCYFCARSLYPFKHLDINNTVTFYSQYDTPTDYRRVDDVDFDDEMYVFIDDDSYGGYYAFQQLLQQFWFTVPLAWAMIMPPVSVVGERVYEYIAENRNQHFVCSFDSDEMS